MLVFGLPPGGGFRHSEDFRTIFAADELLHVLQGVLVIADPETGEVQRAGAGESVFFRRDTWHHAFALGAEPLRVLELFAPPPAAGASSAYARAQPYLEESRYADDALLGALAAGAPPREPRLRVLRAGRRAVAARPRRAVRGPRQHGAPHGRHARARPGRGRGAARARRRRGADGARGDALGAGLVRRRRARVRARARGRLLPAGRQPARVPQRRRRDRARDLRHRAELPAVTVAVGVDVGATKIAAARVDVERGDDRSPRAGSRPPPSAAPRPCWPTAARWRPSWATGAARSGSRVCELVDPRGRVRSAETVDWRDARPARRRSTCVESDVRAAALAEARFGAGRDEPDFLYVSVGSGISHCLMSGGRPAPRRARERDRHRRAAGRALVGRARARAPHRARDGGGGARRSGRGGGRSRTPRGGSALVLAALVNALDPGAVIVGGGLGLHDGYRERVEAALRAEIYDPEARRLPVLPAALGADAPVIGAALAAVARARA